MSKLLPRLGPILSKPRASQAPPASKGASGTSEGVPEGASSTVPHYTSASKVAAASARGTAASEAPSTPAGPAALPSAPSSMDVDMLELLGYKPDSINHVFLGGCVDTMNQDFKAAITSLDAISDLLNWTTVNQCNITPSLPDDICSHLVPLINTVRDLRLFEQYLSHDSEEGTRHSSVKTSLSQLISTPGIAAFTTVLEALQAAKRQTCCLSLCWQQDQGETRFLPWPRPWQYCPTSSCTPQHEAFPSHSFKARLCAC